jgi:hypothetical protein
VPYGLIGCLLHTGLVEIGPVRRGRDQGIDALIHGPGRVRARSRCCSSPRRTGVRQTYVDSSDSGTGCARLVDLADLLK